MKCYKPSETFHKYRYMTVMYKINNITVTEWKKDFTFQFFILYV